MTRRENLKKESVIGKLSKKPRILCFLAQVKLHSFRLCPKSWITTLTRLLGFRFYKDAIFFFFFNFYYRNIGIYMDILSYICMYDRWLGCSPFVHTQRERSRYFFVTTISFISHVLWLNWSSWFNMFYIIIFYLWHRFVIILLKMHIYEYEWICLGFNTKDRRRDMDCVICVMTWSSDASVRASRCFSYWR